MANLINWIKQNKLITTVIVVLFVWAIWPEISWRIQSKLNYGYDSRLAYEEADYGVASAPSFSKSTGSSIGMQEAVYIDGNIPASDEYFISPPIDLLPPSTTSERIVVRDASMGMVVEDVVASLSEIIEFTQSIDGYMVSSSITSPEEVPYAYITLRVPSKNFDAAVNYFRTFGVKMTFESINGRDVTDEFEDIEEHIDQLEKTKSQLVEIRDKAEEIEDLLSVTNQITNIQRQIDDFKGRKKYLEQTAMLSSVSLTLSTDELALPYAPTDTFRPALIFKQAIRSLYGTVRDVAEFGIWLGVYAVIWVPLLLIAVWLYRKNKKKTNQI